MDTAISVLLWAHWGGLALIVVGYIMSLAAGVIHPIMIWGARLQFLIGLAMVGAGEMAGYQMDHMWVGIKLVIALAVVAFCEIAGARAKRGQNKQLFVHFAALFTVINVLYALFGH